MKQINSATTGFQQVGLTLPNEIGTQHGGTGVARLQSVSPQEVADKWAIAQTGTSLRTQLQSCEGRSRLLRMARNVGRLQVPPTPEQLLTLRAFVAALRGEGRPTADQAIKMATGLIGLYRASDLHDPKTFVAGMSAVFQSYPVEAGLIAACPVNGIPKDRKFAPSIAEAHEFLEKVINEAWDFRNRLLDYGVCGKQIVFKEQDPVRFDAVLKNYQQRREGFRDLELPFICYGTEMEERINRTIDYWKQNGQAE